LKKKRVIQQASSVARIVLSSPARRFSGVIGKRQPIAAPRWQLPADRIAVTT